MNTTAWRTDITGRKVPTKPHLVPCGFCGGAGTVLGEGRSGNDPYAPEFECETCAGSGEVQCADDGCCDFDPPEDQ